MKELILAIDIGSSSVKCNAYSIDEEEHGEQQAQEQQSSLQILAQSAQVLRAVQPYTGKVIAFSTIVSAVEECITQVLASLTAVCGRDFVVVSVGFSSFTMNLIGLDADGRPLGEEATISYACNTNEVVQEVEHLKRTLGEEQQEILYQRTGTPIHSAYAVPQLRVFYETQTQLAEQVHQWQPLSNLCIARWTSTNSDHNTLIRGMPMSFCEASWTGLLNFRTGSYEPAALALLPSDACRQALPSSVCDVDESVVSGLAPEFRIKWPQLSEACFFLGLGDGAVANLGSKCSVPDRIACTIGTSAAARVCVPLPLMPPQQENSELSTLLRVPSGLFCYRIDRNNVLLGGALTDGGSAIEWIRQLLNLNDPKEFEQCIERVGKAVMEAENEAHIEVANQKSNVNKPHITTVPFLSGERSTGYRSGATGVLFGLTRETTANDLVQSCLEGVTLRLGAIIDRIQQFVQPHDNEQSGESSASFRAKIIVSGKGLEVNRVWRQMIANCTGLETILDKGTFGGTCRGVAVLILSKMRELDSLPVEPVGGHETLRYPPQPESATYWKQLGAQQEGLIAAVSPLYGSCKV